MDIVLKKLNDCADGIQTRGSTPRPKKVSMPRAAIRRYVKQGKRQERHPGTQQLEGTCKSGATQEYTLKWG